jgi:arylsulfatase A-like enzyme
MTQKPNIVFLLNDHQTFYGHGERVGGPKIIKPHFERLAKEGMEFTRAYTCCPLCAPARRSMLTGLFPHTHGELSNKSFNPFSNETYLDKLAEAGYKNYYFGKWHAGPGTAYDHRCEGFSYPGYNNPYTKAEYKKYLKENNLPHFQVRLQRSFNEPKTKYGKIHQSRIQSGELHSLDRAVCNEHTVGIMGTPKETHEAFFLGHLACEKIKEIAKSETKEPFHLRVDFWGPHQPYFATQEYLDKYPPENIPELPSFRESLENKPSLYKFERNFPLHEGGKIIYPNPLPWSEWQKVLAMNYAQQTLIDEAGGLILDALDEFGFRDNTLVMWSTDHGDALGCHGGHFDKDTYMPEEMMRIPLAVRYPNVISAGQKSEKLVSNLDLPLTFLEVAGARFSNAVHGKSFLPICVNKNEEWREDLMCETNGHFTINIGRMIVTDQYKYISNDKDMDELYDLKNDPFELKNLVYDQKYKEVLIDMNNRLEKWRQKTNDKITRKTIRDERVRFVKEHMNKSTSFDF